MSSNFQLLTFSFYRTEVSIVDISKDKQKMKMMKRHAHDVGVGRGEGGGGGEEARREGAITRVAARLAINPG